VIDPIGAIDPVGLGLLAHKAGDNTDVTSAFLSFTGGVVTVNIEVTNLDKTVPPPTDSQGGVAYYAFWSFNGAVHFVRAQNQSGTDFTYGYGTADPASGVYTTEGTTKGAIFEGAKGIVQIEVPAAAGGAAGSTLKGVVVTVDGFTGGPDDASGFNNHIDLAPDNADVLDPNGKDFEVAECVAGPATTTPGADATATELPLAVTKVLDGAKKAKKKKAIRITVKASEEIANLSVSLKAKNGKGKTYASAKLPSVSGTATLKCKLKAKLKPGSYSLVAKGTVGGTTRKATLAVKVKK
jgi:methionine-rich copper-binding protein CopC